MSKKKIVVARTSLEKTIKDLENVKAKMFRMGQELFKSRKKEGNLIAEISGSQASLVRESKISTRDEYGGA